MISGYSLQLFLIHSFFRNGEGEVKKMRDGKREGGREMGEKRKMREGRGEKDEGLGRRGEAEGWKGRKPIYRWPSLSAKITRHVQCIVGQHICSGPPKKVQAASSVDCHEYIHTLSAQLFANHAS